MTEATVEKKKKKKKKTKMKEERGECVSPQKYIYTQANQATAIHQVLFLTVAAVNSGVRWFFLGWLIII